MITLGIIADITSGKDSCRVSLPMFQTTNDDNVAMVATLSYPPGMSGGYKTGDVVFVSFYNNTLTMPVVLGKLYAGTDTTMPTTMGADSSALDDFSDWVGTREFQAEEKATLPKESYLTLDSEVDSHITTFIDKNVQAKTVYLTADNKTVNIFELLNLLCEKTLDLQARVEVLEEHVGKQPENAGTLVSRVGSLETSTSSLKKQIDTHTAQANIHLKLEDIRNSILDS